MGRDLSRGKITASHLEEEMNTEFEMSVVSNFLVSRSSPADIKSPSNAFADFVLGRSTRLRVAVAEDIFFASKNPIQKKKQQQHRRRRRKIGPTFTECLRSMPTKLKPPEGREVFSIKNILPFCPLHLICIGHNLK